MKRWIVGVVVLGLTAAGCSDDGGGGAADTAAPTTSVSAPDTTSGVTETTPVTDGDPEPLLAGAASRSVLPTVNGARDYLADAPGWAGTADPDDIGVFVPAFDQGIVDVGNGEGDGSWVHDDLRTTALALQKGPETVVIVTADVYMIFKADAAEIERRAREQLADMDQEHLHIAISATHDHHGPDTAFSVNDQWYEQMASEMVDAIEESIQRLEPARVETAQGEHRFGQADARDPNIVDPHLNVMRLAATAEPDRTIATVVQWASHPETTLGWNPPGDITAECATKGWAADDCSADGRYFTADYPGVLRERLISALGGEVLYLNGALGSQIGPGRADVWLVDDQHPVGDGVTAPSGAQPVPGAEDLRARNLSRTDAIGTQLTLEVLSLLDGATPLDTDLQTLAWRVQPFFTRLTNIGFRVLLADGDLGWQTPAAYTCAAKPFTTDNCTEDAGALVDDPVLTPLVDSQIRVGDVLETQLIWVSIGDLGFLFMPGELPPELVIGLPSDFTTDTAKYFDDPTLHATGADYRIPGALLALSPTSQTFTVGLGGDELGYWTPIDEVRLKCLDLVMPAGSGVTCQALFDKGLLVAPDAVDGPTCRSLTDEPPASPTPDQSALVAVCRYGQALGRELGEPDDHYEETNSAGWDLVDDTWAAALQLFGS